MPEYEGARALPPSSERMTLLLNVSCSAAMVDNLNFLLDRDYERTGRYKSPGEIIAAALHVVAWAEAEQITCHVGRAESA